MDSSSVGQQKTHSQRGNLSHAQRETQSAQSFKLVFALSVGNLSHAQRETPDGPVLFNAHAERGCLSHAQRELPDGHF